MESEKVNLNLPRLLNIILNVFRLLSIACFLYCSVGLVTSINRNYPLWIDPLYAEGTIVDHKATSWQSPRNSGGYTEINALLPIVEFHDASNTAIVFNDNIGQSAAVLGGVPVIYARSNPANARIDRGLLNWLDTYIWLFGTGSGLLGMIRLSGPNIAKMKELSRHL